MDLALDIAVIFVKDGGVHCRTLHRAGSGFGLLETYDFGGLGQCAVSVVIIGFVLRTGSREKDFQIGNIGGKATIGCADSQSVSELGVEFQSEDSAGIAGGGDGSFG